MHCRDARLCATNPGLYEPRQRRGDVEAVVFVSAPFDRRESRGVSITTQDMNDKRRPFENLRDRLGASSSLGVLCANIYGGPFRLSVAQCATAGREPSIRAKRDIGVESHAFQPMHHSALKVIKPMNRQDACGLHDLNT